MKCFIKSFIFGLDSDQNSRDACAVVNPIVRSLVSSSLFVILMAVVVNMLHV